MNKKLFETWNGKCYISGIKLKTNPKEYNDPLYAVVDHKISVHYGFKNNIDFKIVGNISNLEICSRKINGEKWNKTLEEYKSLEF